MECPCQQKVEKLEEDIKVIKKNLVGLGCLLVGDNVFVREDVFVKGRIFNFEGSLPGFDPCTTNNTNGASFNINLTSGACTTITQGASVRVASSVFYGSNTNGAFTIVNQSTMAGVRLVNLANNAITTINTDTTVIANFENGTLTSVITI